MSIIHPTTAKRQQDKDRASIWAGSILDRNNWAILDTETTGLERTAQAVQIGVLTSDNLEGWQTLVKPTVPIGLKAAQIHGIREQRLTNAPAFDEVFVKLLTVIGGRELIIYNSAYDLRIIQESALAKGIFLSFSHGSLTDSLYWLNGRRVYCAMEAYSQWIGEWNYDYGSYRWQRLPGGDHTALGDCRATLQVLQNMAKP